MSDRRSLSSRLLAAYSITFLAVIALLGFVLDLRLREQALEDLTSQLVEEATEVASNLPTDPALLDVWTNQIAAIVDARVTVIAADGAVTADSAEDPDQMDNHRDRPEVAAALGGEVGTSRRFSDTLQERLLYVAVPAGNGGAVRLAVDDARVDHAVRPITATVVSLAALAGLLGIGVVYLVVRRISRPITQLTNVATTMAAGDVVVQAPRSATLEFDRLGSALNAMTQQLGGRAAEAERERNTLDTVLSALDQAIVLIGQDEDVLYTNPASAALLGPLNNLAGLARIGGMVRQARETNTSIVEDGLEHGRHGRLLRVSVIPFGGRVLVVAADVTHTYRLEKIRRDFVADASHELKTPVASVLAASETLQTALTRDPAKAAEFAERVHDSAKQLARLISDLLDLSRLEAGNVEAVAVDLQKVVLAETERIKGRVMEQNIRCSVETKPVTVIGTAADFGLAIRNLLDNALRYTTAGSISVTLRRVAGEAVLTVSDTGEGIPRRALDRVFERFFRVDVARSRQTGGTGLGLSIVKHVAERYGGSVTVESELGAGSTFTIRLPLDEELVGEPLAP